ncbi:Glutathione S-transferase C-terminal-like [Trinorchestia longiramus]|nr:Glutathione S-transferase C-terminal-like [Trinorchestia longiramus]
MLLSTDVLHPNGFKIAIALNISGKRAVIKNEKGIYEGAVLKVPDPCTRAPLGLAPNSAVLFLMSSAASQLPEDGQEEWLSWETSHFQRTVWAYLQNAGAGKADQAAKAALLEALARLEDHLSNSPFIAGQSVGASDVVVGSSVLLLPAVQSAASLLVQHSAVSAYIHKLADCPAVKVGTLHSHPCCISHLNESEASTHLVVLLSVWPHIKTISL